MRHHHAIGFLDGRADGLPIVGREGAQVDHLDADVGVLPLHLHGSLQSFLDHRAVGHDGEAVAGLDDFGAAERDGEVRAGMRRAIVRLAIQALVLEEQNRIVAADGGAQQAAGIQRVRRHHHAQAGDVRELHLAALAVIDGAAVQIAADGDAQHDGAEKPPLERQRMVASSSRICIMAGQM